MAENHPWVYVTTTDDVGFEKYSGEIEIEIDVSADIIFDHNNKTGNSARYMVESLSFHSISLYNENGDVTSKLSNDELEELNKLCSKILPRITRDAQAHLDKQRLSIPIILSGSLH